jgi:hypothetical protein
MRTQHFEVVVLGGTTAAATIAALLAKRGVRGLLVDEGETTSGPADVAFADPRSSAFDLVASEIGLVRELEHERRAAAAHRVQVVFPDMRAELPIERAALLDEGARRLSAPRLGPALEALEALEERTAAFLAEAGELPAPGFFARQRLGGVARRHAAVLGDGRAVLAQAGGLGEALAGLMPFLTYQDFVASEPLPALAVGRLAARFLRGLGAPPQPFGERLLEVAEKSGFERVHGAIDRLEAGAKPLRFALAKSGGALTADVLIDASTDLAGLRTISQRGRPRALGVLLEAAMPRGQLHALALELDRSVLPPPLGDFVLLLNGRRAARAGEDGAPEADDRPILLLRAPLPSTPAHRARFLALHPISHVSVHAEGVERLERVMRARIERLVPFYGDGHPSLSRAAVRAHPLYDHELDTVAGVARVSLRTPYKHVFVAGPVVLPGLGAEGELRTALAVTHAVLDALGRDKAGRLK